VIATVAGMTRMAVARMAGVAVIRVPRVAVARMTLGRVPARGTAVGAGKRRQGKGED
jgi:hypothetical protein